MDSFRINLQGEYKLLQTDLKKHYLKIQNDITVWIKLLNDKEKLGDTLTKTSLEILLKPIGLIITVRAHKLFFRCISCLQKIAMHTITHSSDNILLILQLILPVWQDEDIEEMVKIKMLQTMMLFLDPKNIKFDRQIIKLILICILKLYDTDSNLVKNTSLATIRQLYSLIFSNLQPILTEESTNTEHYSKSNSNESIQSELNFKQMLALNKPIPTIEVNKLNQEKEEIKEINEGQLK